MLLKLHKTRGKRECNGMASQQGSMRPRKLSKQINPLEIFNTSDLHVWTTLLIQRLNSVYQPTNQILMR